MVVLANFLKSQNSKSTFENNLTLIFLCVRPKSKKNSLPWRTLYYSSLLWILHFHNEMCKETMSFQQESLAELTKMDQNILGEAFQQ